ncbi:MAG: shikimate dehydrogenase [Bacteroidia bacterium]|nr:shikimate dehydrogenase [Bacteroidia bacterium]
MSVRLFGLIGFPLTHSFSEQYFTEKFQREGIKDAMYRKFPITDINLVPDLIKCHPNLKGFNVTIPYKETIIPLLDELDETAKVVGAVNTVVCQASATLSLTNNNALDATNNVQLRLKGYNTDVYGFRQSIKPFLATQHERALILGTGGASKAVEYVLRSIGVECVFVSRSDFGSAQSDSANANDNTAQSNNAPKRTILKYSDLNEYVIGMCKLIVNCTPVGTFPNVNEAPAIPYEYITSDHFLYDLVYNPAETEFLRRGKERGAMIQNGYDMLKMQAEKAWTIFNL